LVKAIYFWPETDKSRVKIRLTKYNGNPDERFGFFLATLIHVAPGHERAPGGVTFYYKAVKYAG